MKKHYSEYQRFSQATRLKLKPSLRRKIESSKYVERVLWHFLQLSRNDMKGAKHINVFKGQISKTLSTIRQESRRVYEANIGSKSMSLKVKE